MSGKQEKWWEFYGVRYAQGTVVGAMIVYFLFSQNDLLKEILFLPSEPKDFGMAHLTLLAIYGLTFCYVASAPILVLHAGRGLLFESSTNPAPYDGFLKRAVLFMMLSLPIPIYYYFTERQITGALALLAYTLALSLQVIIIARIFHFRWDETINYYRAIIGKRVVHEPSGYVESYKHIREHGNSFLIVFFEFLLAVPIFEFVSRPSVLKEDAILHLCLIIFLWLLPAAAIWAFGNKLESHMQSM